MSVDTTARVWDGTAWVPMGSSGFTVRDAQPGLLMWMWIRPTPGSQMQPNQVYLGYPPQIRIYEWYTDPSNWSRVSCVLREDGFVRDLIDWELTCESWGTGVKPERFKDSDQFEARFHAFIDQLAQEQPR